MKREEAIAYMMSPRAVRERCGQIFSLAKRGELSHFVLHEVRLPAVVAAVWEETKLNYPDGKVPFHSRWRHFGAGGVPREAILDAKLASLPPIERARAKIELAVVSVLLDAGAGDAWTYRDADARRSFGRSEGLAVASFDCFVRGLFGDGPLRVTAEKLCDFSAAALGEAFQVSEKNPLPGLDGRADLLRQLGQVIKLNQEAFAGAPGRLGGMLEPIATLAGSEGTVDAENILVFILKTFGPIWPGRISIGGCALGDVWKHSQVVGPGETDKLVAFHKLSQWLTYSLLEPLAEAGVRVVNVDGLTGLAEYRNGGLLVDSGVLELRDPSEGLVRHHPSAELVVEWRALTVSLLDQLAAQLRSQLGLSNEDLPLAKILQGGTWSLGRKLAAERRPHATPPIGIESDGTVF